MLDTPLCFPGFYEDSISPFLAAVAFQFNPQFLMLQLFLVVHVPYTLGEFKLAMENHHFQSVNHQNTFYFRGHVQQICLPSRLPLALSASDDETTCTGLASLQLRICLPQVANTGAHLSGGNKILHWMDKISPIHLMAESTPQIHINYFIIYIHFGSSFWVAIFRNILPCKTNGTSSP